VGQVLEVMGALISMSARSAVEKANADQMAAMQRIVSDMVDHNEDAEKSQDHWRELGALFAQINKNLVLRLILNGLKTQFVTRMTHLGLPVTLDRVRSADILLRIDAGLNAGNAREVAEAIRDHFQLLREAVASALVATSSDTRSSPNAEHA
jgi:DNA-binding FadR family transcriptional regulator